MKRFYTLIFTLILLVLILGINLRALAKNKSQESPLFKIQESIQVQQWRSLSGTSVSMPFSASYPQQGWWRAIGDEHLNGYIETALKDNPSLQAIGVQIDEAREVAKTYKSSLLPSVNQGFDYLWQQYSKRQFLFPLESRTFQSFQLPLSTNYDVDIWGKSRDKYHMAKQDVRIAMIDYQNAAVQLQTQVAGTYFNLVKFNQLTQDQSQMVALAERDLFHTQRLVEYGLGTSQDLSDKRLQLSQAQSELYLLQGNQRVAQNQLAVLLGMSPSKIESMPTTSFDDIELPKLLVAGVPSEFVVHRPDVAIMEAELEKARLNTLIARKMFLPTVTLQGEYGFSAIGISKLFRLTSISSFVRPMISQPIFQGGQLKANLHLSKKETQRLLLNYQDTLVKAVSEVENALAMAQINQAVYTDISNQLRESTKKATQQNRLVVSGISAEPAWIPSEVERLSLHKAQSQQKAQLFIDYVSVVKALGGGFNANAQN